MTQVTEEAAAAAAAAAARLVCPVCNYRFVNAEVYDEHLRTAHLPPHHHIITGNAAIAITLRLDLIEEQCKAIRSLIKL